jgi:hypothetical protein
MFERLKLRKKRYQGEYKRVGSDESICIVMLENISNQYQTLVDPENKVRQGCLISVSGNGVIRRNAREKGVMRAFVL